MSAVKLCKDCAWFYADAIQCWRPTGGVDVVTGGASSRYRNCYVERAIDSDTCGPDAQFWKPRPVFVEPPPPPRPEPRPGSVASVWDWMWRRDR